MPLERRIFGPSRWAMRLIRHEAVGIDLAVEADRDRLHILVVIMRQAAVIVMVMIVAVMVVIVVVVIVVVVLRFEEGRLDFEIGRDRSVLAEHGVERHLAFRRLVQGRVRIDGADARLDFAQFFRRDDPAC